MDSTPSKSTEGLLVRLRETKSKMTTVLHQIAASQHSSDGTQRDSSSVADAKLDLRVQFNALYDEARAMDRVVNPHPLLRMPLDIIREIFATAARSDPDIPFLLTEICLEWRALALETPTLWSNIRIAVDEEDALGALPLALLLSKNRALDIVLTGVGASHRLLDDLAPHSGRIRSLEVLLYEQAREPFRVLGRTLPDGLNRLSRLSIEDGLYNGGLYNPEETLRVSLLHPFERARRHKNTLDEGDLRMVQSLAMLSSLSALVIDDAGTTTSVPLQFPNVKSLRLFMKDTPSLLQNLTCNRLETLDVVIDDLSREGWWDVLCISLAHPRLESLAVDVTLAREKNDWSQPWTAQDLPRLPAHKTLSKIIVALSFADQDYKGAHKDPEYLCGDMLEGLIASSPLLTDLRLLHVPFFHAPFIWPMPHIMLSLRKLELQVPAIVFDKHRAVIVLPNLRDLRYYGNVAPQTTQLPTLRTPFLEYLEIMHSGWSIHPVLVQVDRHWPNTQRKPIHYQDYSVALRNSSRNFPPSEELPNPEGDDKLLPVIHQSTALRELRLHFGTMFNRPEFMPTRFPNLRILYCSVVLLEMIDAPNIEELHLLWFSRDESKRFDAYPTSPQSQRTLGHVRLLDIYSHTDRRYHEGSLCIGLYLRHWVQYLDALETIVLPQLGQLIDQFTEILSENPQICPTLATIDSFGYPRSWFALRDCLESRNHLAMRDHHIQVIHTLRFPLALHRNITDRLKEVLSGRFAAPFEAVPLQPWAIEELISSEERERVGQRPEHICFGCLQSGNAFGCFGPEPSPPFGAMDCQRHSSRRPGRGVVINAYVMNITGYLE